MDMLDVVALCGLEWAYDKVEERYGTAAAWVVTIAVAALMGGALIAVILARLSCPLSHPLLRSQNPGSREPAEGQVGGTLSLGAPKQSLLPSALKDKLSMVRQEKTPDRGTDRGQGMLCGSSISQSKWRLCLHNVAEKIGLFTHFHGGQPQRGRVVPSPPCF